MIAYENRNGCMYCYDTENREMILSHPYGWTEEDAGGTLFAMGIGNVGPERFREELESRSVKEVWVYAGVPPWISSSMGSATHKSRSAKFRNSAGSAAVMGNKNWVAVPIERINDGSDWLDTYLSKSMQEA